MASPGEKERKTKEPSTGIASLPDDLVLNCIARVSRSYHLTLSLVSKRFRSLLASEELYNIRSLLGCTESCLYACFGFDESYYYTLCQKPNSRGYALAQVPIPPLRGVFNSSLVAVGSNIYFICGTSCTLTILDCLSHTLREGLSLPVKLLSLTASSLDGKIYVAGCNSEERNAFQVFDTRTQTWDPEPTPCLVAKQGFGYSTSVCVGGRFLLISGLEELAYSAKDGRWEVVDRLMRTRLYSESYCEIGDVVYARKDRLFQWFDIKTRCWRDLKGLVGLPHIDLDTPVRLGDRGGKMAVLWTCSLDSLSWGLIGYVEIALERCDETVEISGTVEFCEVVFTSSPVLHRLIKVLSVTV